MMLEDLSLSTPSKAHPTGLDDMTEEQLLDLRDALDLKLQVELKHLNMTEELGLQYRQGKKLLTLIQNDRGTPANQVAQLFNSVAGMLERIVKLQEMVYSAERLKAYEAAFLKAIETLPKEGKEAFFELYQQYLDQKGS
jgi:DNA mismatch repair ATPase MutS